MDMSHPALCVAEIVREICFHLAVTVSADEEQDVRLRSLTRESKIDLRSLAMTCKVVQEPALDALWKVIDGLIPVLNLMDGVVKPSGWSLQGAINWERALYYSRRVKTLNATKIGKPILSSSSCFRLVQRDQPVLFPSMRHAAVSVKSGNHIPEIYLLLSPLLESVKYVVQAKDADDTWSRDYLNSLAFAASSLQKLHVSGVNNDGLHAALPHMRTLQHITLEKFEGSLFLNLALRIRQLPSLRSIDVGCTWTISKGFTSEGFGKPTFRALQHFTCRRGGFLAAVFLEECNTPNLCTVTIPSKPSSDCLNRLKCIMSGAGVAAIRSSTVHHLSLSWVDGNGRKAAHLGEDYTRLDSTGLSDTRDVFDPFAGSKCHVETLHIEGFPRLRMDDAMVDTLSKALPKLTSLVLPYSSVEFECPTLKSLITIAENCPALRHLCMTIAQDNTVPLADVPALKHGLQELVIGEAVPKDTRSTGRCLDKLFPTLRVCRSDDHPIEWGRVEAYLQACQDTRDSMA